MRLSSRYLLKTVVIASAAKQPSDRRDCFVATLLAMTHACRLRRRRDRQAAGDAVALDQARDEAGLLRFLDEIAQEGEAGRVLLGRPDRLLHGGELAGQDARARQLGGDVDEARAQPGIGVHLLVREGLDRLVGAVELQELPLLVVV